MNNNSMEIVKKHFSEDCYIKEMLGRNILGLKKWEKIVVEKYFKNKGSKILDIGCGTGREAFSLAKIGYNITGIDISVKEINIAKEESQKQNLNIDFKLCNGINLEFDDNFFGYSIIWAQTMGNIYTKKNRTKLLNENKRVLKDNGILCFSTHDYDFIISHFKKYTKGNRFYPYINSKCYWKLFTINEIREMVEESGFNILFCGKSKELVNTDETDVLVCICEKRQHCI